MNCIEYSRSSKFYRVVRKGGSLEELLDWHNMASCSWQCSDKLLGYNNQYLSSKKSTS
jgi:hypothetical protein